MHDSDRQPPTLPGYTLTARLGAGGYGEVWLAQAPGGVPKAVKFIFGSFNDRRAEHELRALHRIKSVRHPFLLSLERIEVVDDRLAIVTELADSSLKDRYDECRRQGLPGIPRSELLGYMHDAAEALDYLSERHSLQHLDVKPENLLLVAGHVKVADFGLVKEVGKTQASLVGGLTPLYSSPEVFQGMPGARSDQYSLAVVYQEMLTGTPPLAGANAAELTMQHLQGEANLAPLPMSDRFAIARALAKDPTQRFPNCSAMIDALLAQSSASAQPSDAAEFAGPEPSDGRTFSDFGSALPERRAEQRPGPMEPLFAGPHAETQFEAAWGDPANEWGAAEQAPDEPAEPHRVDAVEFSAEGFSSRPTLVIGIGGAAACVMRRFRARVARELSEEAAAAVQLLLFDSDPREISAALQGNERNALRPNEAMALPLRRPQEYREDSALLMRWLSRRWLYNIPKSLRTEGLRPLGRLAFVDHAQRVEERLIGAIQGAVAAQDVGNASPRIYLVASVSGGTGSGMSLDLGYAIRSALATLGIDDGEVVGLFLHSTDRDPRQAELARVNSCAWLREYNHYHRAAGSYPGDEACGLPALAPACKAFDAAYFLNLGDGLKEEAWSEATADVAEYLYLDAVTPAQQFFAACREQAKPGDEATLRSFAVTTVSAAADDAIEAAAQLISRSVVCRWLGVRTNGEAGKNVAPTAVAGDAPASQLPTLEHLASQTRKLITQTLADSASLQRSEMGLSERIAAVNADFAAPDDRPGAFVGGRPLEQVAAPIAQSIAATMSTEVMEQVDSLGLRVPGAEAAIGRWRGDLQQLDAEASKIAAALSQQAAAMAMQIDRWQRERSNTSASTAREQELCDGYRDLRTDQHSLLAVALVAKRALAELRGVGDRIGELARQLKGMLARFPADAPQGEPSAFTGLLSKQLTSLCDRVDERLEQSFTQPSGGLIAVAMGSPRVREQLVVELTKAATRQAEQLASSPTLAAGASFAAETDASDPGIDSSQLPHVLPLNSTYAVLETRPSAIAGIAVQQASANGVTTLVGVGSQTVRCVESWNLSPSRTALDLVDRRRDCLEFADRVSSRCDVDWIPLAAPPRRMPAVAAVPFEASPMAMTQVL
ncbi:tubulin-like doman-containing protein [Lacipirellula sp.]|uniref:tubulin-like doman-containing protein n=1 Tax=Lacipirellula sp. TaxID=2691419 RepID=UPI003D0D0CED